MTSDLKQGELWRTEVTTHKWFQPSEEGFPWDWICCRDCGVVRRLDYDAATAKPCRGKVKIGLREGARDDE